MKNTKKLLAVLLAGAMSIGVLAGCGAKQQETAAPAPEAPAAEDGGGG